jgi:hypothetical protein
METGNVTFIRHLYHENKALKVYTTYQLKYVEDGTNQLTEVLRIEDYRGFSGGNGFNDYLRLRTTNNWKTSEQVTGLKFTKNENIFFGDRLQNGKKNLLLFQFTNNRKSLIIDYFPNYYPASTETIQELIKIHFTA